MSALLMFGQSMMSASPVREGCARTCRALVNTTAFEQFRRNSKRAEMRSPLLRSTYVGLLKAGRKLRSENTHAVLRARRLQSGQPPAP
jgi:hypothetical protein